jgi:hypothetical protein
MSVKDQARPATLNRVTKSALGPCIGSLCAAALILVGCAGPSSHTVAQQIADKLGFDSAECPYRDTDTYTCNVFQNGRSVLTMCTAPIDDSPRWVGGCERSTPRFPLVGRTWDDVESAFASQHLKMYVDLPLAADGLGAGVEAHFQMVGSVKDAGGERGVDVVLAVLAGNGEAATAVFRSRQRLVRLLFGYVDSYNLEDFRQGRIVRRGRLIVWYQKEFSAEVQEPLQAALAAMPSSVVSG